MDKLLSPQIVCEILGIHYRKVLEFILTHQLKAYKVGHQYKISESAIRDFLEKNKVK